VENNHHRLECFRSFREAAKLQDCLSQIVELHCFGISGAAVLWDPISQGTETETRTKIRMAEKSASFEQYLGSELFTSMSLQTPDKNTKNIENKD
jgi:hypothetical protein